MTLSVPSLVFTFGEGDETILRVLSGILCFGGADGATPNESSGVFTLKEMMELHVERRNTIMSAVYFV